MHIHNEFLTHFSHHNRYRDGAVHVMQPAKTTHKIVERDEAGMVTATYVASGDVRVDVIVRFPLLLNPLGTQHMFEMYF